MNHTSKLRKKQQNGNKGTYMDLKEKTNKEIQARLESAARKRTHKK